MAVHQSLTGQSPKVPVQQFMVTGQDMVSQDRMNETDNSDSETTIPVYPPYFLERSKHPQPPMMGMPPEPQQPLFQMMPDHGPPAVQGYQEGDSRSQETDDRSRDHDRESSRDRKHSSRRSKHSRDRSRSRSPERRCRSRSRSRDRDPHRRSRSRYRHRRSRSKDRDRENQKEKNTERRNKGLPSLKEQHISGMMPPQRMPPMGIPHMVVPGSMPSGSTPAKMPPQMAGQMHQTMALPSGIAPPITGQPGGGISLKPVSKFKCVFGTFHQASDAIFRHAAAGTQCSTICMIAVTLSSLKRADLWVPNDVDKILIEGDKLHMKILQETEWPYGKKESKLDIDELPDIISCNMNDTKITASVGLKNEDVYGFSSEIDTVVLQALKKKPSNSFIIRMHDKCRAILLNSNGRYSVFDPHACAENGLTDPNGFACVIHFDVVSEMLAYFKNVVEGMKNEQVDVSPIDIELLSLEAEVQSSNPEAIGENKEELEVIERTDSTKCPVYMRRHKGLSIKEIISLCVLEEIEESKICRTVPPPSKDAVYVLDLSEIDIKDITCDDAGIYDCHSSPSTIVKANIEGKEILNITTLSRRKVDINETCFQESDIYKVKRMYSEKKENNSKASRIVSRVYIKEKHARYATVQYIGDRICSLRPHKNSKSKDAYLRTKPSVIREEKDLAAEVAPKQVINRIDSNNNNLNYSSASDGPRDRQQIYNVKKKMNSKFKARNTGKLINPDFGKLVASMDNGDFLKDIDFSYRHKFNRIHPNTFAATDNSLTWLKTFCSTNSEFKSQLGIDMTYKIGPFYTTCLSFPHPIFVHKNDRQKHPTVFVGMMTSTGRQTEDYMYMANQLKSRGISNLIYGTDGEYALELGMESVFPIDGVSPDKRSVKLRCFNHLTDNLDMELKKYDVNRNEIIASILGQEYENKRISGLVDCSTLDFDREYRKLSVNWPQEFINYLEAKELKVRSIKDTLKKCMSQDIRKAAGLGNPPNKYDNQRAESMNSVLKEAIGEHYVDQAAVHDYVNENLMKPQEKELVKAIYCHGEYRLSQRFKHLEIAPLEWKTMSDDQKTNHVNKILRCKVAIGNDTPVITKKLSIQPQDCDHCLNDMPLGLINDLWNSAEIMLSVAHIITLANGNHCITYENDFFLITEKNLDFHCKCERFGKLQLCSHVMIIADQRNALESLLSKFRYNPSHAIYKHKPISAGEKRVSKPRKGVQNVKKKAIYVPVETNIIPDDHIDLRIQRPYQFNEIWQNDEPFELLKVKDLKQPENQSLHCVSCKNVIRRRNAIPPYDIVFCHKERYKYPSRETNGNVVWKETEKRMANKYYCIKKTCLLGRHPYFWNGLINSDKISLKEEHVRLLQRELDFQV